jgi:hydroxymethylpyrimidine pyrophosphatase-like HAD family hydrolase
VVVSGDSGNDVEMFVPPRDGSPYRGIVVGNADADLKRLKGEHIYHAQAACAAGVLEGLRFWSVL